MEGMEEDEYEDGDDMDEDDQQEDLLVDGAGMDERLQQRQSMLSA